MGAPPLLTLLTLFVDTVDIVVIVDIVDIVAQVFIAALIFAHFACYCLARL